MIDAKLPPNFVEFTSSDPELASEITSGIFDNPKYSALPQSVGFHHSICVASIDDIYAWQTFSSTGFLLSTEAPRYSRFELHFIESGSCTSKTMERVVEANVGDALLLKDFSGHDLICQPETSRIGVAIPLARYKRLVGEEFADPIGDLSAMHLSANCRLPGIPCLKQATKLLISVSRSETAANRSSIGAHLLTEAILALFIESWPRVGGARSTQGARPFYIKRAIEWMHAHAAAKVTLEDLSVVSGVSVRTLQLGFRTFSGLSPMAYLLQIRLERAYKDLLTEPKNVTIDEIAKRWGFSNPSKFSGYIRQKYGRNPFAIRRGLKEA